MKVLYETHSHTPLCKHAEGFPGEYASAAEARGFAGLLVTCHNPMPHGFSHHVRMAQTQFDDYLNMVDRARREWADRVDVHIGLEADYFPGYERFLEQQLRSAPFQYVLGSVHPHLQEYRDLFWNNNPVTCQRTYFRMLADCAETGLFDCLAHPDLIKNETPRDWDPQLIMDDVRQVLDRIARTGVAMELNTSGLNKPVPQMNPFPEMLAEMHQRSIPVVIGSDAHQPSRVGDRWLDAMDLLESVGYTEISYYRNRERQGISIKAARQSLAPASFPVVANLHVDSTIGENDAAAT